MNDPTPQPEQDRSWLLVVLLVLLLLANGGNVGGAKSPTKTLPTVPSVFTLYDDDPKAVIDLQSNHAGQYDVLFSNADGAIQTWVLKDQNGKFLKYGLKEPVPDPDPKFVGPWVKEAYDIAKATGKTPWTVASGPNGKGFSGLTPDGQQAAAVLKVIGK